LGIIIKGQRLIGALPFLIGSIGTLCFDATILVQFFIYRGLKPKKRKAARRGSKTTGVHGITHYANSPFQSPVKRDQERGAEAARSGNGHGASSHHRTQSSKLHKSYNGGDWSA
jgi:hypothetical protein